MNIHGLKELILKGESSFLESKERLPNNATIAKVFVGFANTEGGHFVLGINDHGYFVGVKNIDESLKRLDDVAFSRCEPPVKIHAEVLDDKGKEIIIVTIPKGNQRPYRRSDGIPYLRSSNRFRVASWEELRRLYQAGQYIYLDETKSPASLNALDCSAFKSFFQSYIQLSWDEEFIFQYLKNLKLVENENLTLAGVLFFSKKPSDFFHQAKVVAALIPGNDISIPPADKKDFDGTIPEQLEDSSRFLRLYLREEHVIEGFKNERREEIPLTVLREGLVNALAHRDYTVSGPVRLFIFQDRVEIRSPGKLPNTVTIENMKTSVHILRNPVIYNLLNRMGLVTDVGSGVPRMIKTIREVMDKEIGLEVNEAEFILTIPRS